MLEEALEWVRRAPIRNGVVEVRPFYGPEDFAGLAEAWGRRVGSAARRSVEAVWRIESAHVIAAFVRTGYDLDLAEDLAQHALLAALEQWTRAGVPTKPGAWLLAVARRRGVDAVRRRVTLERKLALFTREPVVYDPVVGLDIGDDVLKLMFTACHPLLGRDARSR